MRKDIANIANNLALQGGLDFRILECYNLILDYCKTNNIRPTKNDYEIKTGCLFINNKFIKRVEKLPQKRKFSEKLYYLNGKAILYHEFKKIQLEK